MGKQGRPCYAYYTGSKEDFVQKIKFENPTFAYRRTPPSGSRVFILLCLPLLEATP